MKNKISILILLFVIVIPQVASAAWWNPFSWFNSRSPQIQTTTEVKITPTSTIFYVKSNNTRVRSCPSVECKIMGYYMQGNTIVSTEYKSYDSLPEWVFLSDTNPPAYIHKSTLSDKPIEKTEPQTNGFVPYEPEPKKSSVPDKKSEWVPLTNLCRGKYYPSCSVSQKFYCPVGLLGGDGYCIDDSQQNVQVENSEYCNGEYYSPCSVGDTFTCLASGDAYCLTPIQQQKNTQTAPPNTTLCNGINWSKCPVGQDFVCPATGDAYCQRPPMQSTPPASQQTQTQTSTEDTAKANEIKSLKTQLAELQAQAKILEAERNQGVTNIQDQPIAMSFITGQSATLERQINAKLQTNAAQQSAIITKIATLEGISLPPPIVTTPTYGGTGGGMQCYWYGMDWICSGPGGTGVTTKCYWYGSTWYCN